LRFSRHEIAAGLYQIPPAELSPGQLERAGRLAESLGLARCTARGFVFRGQAEAVKTPGRIWFERRSAPERAPRSAPGYDGAWLRGTREALAWGPERCAAELGVDLPTIHALEQSERLPRLVVLAALALRFGVRADD
jgi:hypothetical protein